MAQRMRDKASEMAKRRDERPVNIVEIYRAVGSNSRSQYVLKVEALHKLLKPIKNLEVVVIAVVGHCRRGKSFLLNYMCRFLSDYKNINGWVRDGNEPLDGFGWKSSSDPQTFGLWLSKPFIVKQSNGKEIGVLLMDTQGLFDEQFDKRDWSTIVGISLLVSSCLIVNVFTDISEDIMSTLDSYINYGLRAAQVNAGAQESIPFQTLLFLIRDWNTPNEFKYGLTGGKLYLEKKLIVRDNQSPEAKNVRLNIAKCFKDVDCFLMPQFGEVMEDKEFNGSFNKLRDRFREKLKEFITTLLNPEELVTKTIYGTPITGDELCQQFQTFVEIFNREELPESQLIIDAKAKLADNNLIRKLKDKHSNQLQTFIQTKPFVTRHEFEAENEVFRVETIEDFESRRKSNNLSLEDELMNHLKQNYEIVFNENEDKRDRYIEERRDVCGQQFMDALNDELKKSGFVESEHLEELFKTYEKKVFDSFKEIYSGEDHKLFKEGFFELTSLINNAEKATRTENYRRLREFDKTKDDYVNKVVDYYNENMLKLLEDNIYLSKEQFKESENVLRNKTDSKFRKEFDFGNHSANETFFLKVGHKLNESKLFFKEKNKDKCQNIAKKTESVVSKAVERYGTEMDERLYLIQTIEDLGKSHQIVLGKVSEDLKNALPFKAMHFVTPYIETFNRETNKLYDTFKTQLTQRIQKRNEKYLTALNEAKDHYIEAMTQSIEAKDFLTSEELNRFHRNYRKSALSVYQNHFDENSLFDALFKVFESNLKDLIEEEFDVFTEKNEKNQKCDENVIKTTLNQSLNTFNTRMNEVFQMSNSDVELSNNFLVLKGQLKREMSDNTQVNDKSLLDQGLLQFETILDQSLEDYRSKLEDRKATLIKAYENKVTKSKEVYKLKMDQILKNNEYITDEEFNEFHETTKCQTISELSYHLKPEYDMDVTTFIKLSEQLIQEEYQHYFVVNEAQRNNRWQRIQDVSRQFIIEYETKINYNIDSIQCESELLAKHDRILEEIIEKSKLSNDLCDKKLISIQVTVIESEISKLLEHILAKFWGKMETLRETYEKLFEKSKVFYKNKMDSIFKNNEFYPDEDFTKYIIKIRGETLKHFEKQLESLEGLGMGLQELTNTYLDQLNAFIDYSNPLFVEKNDENKLLFNEKVKEEAKLIKQKYVKTLNSEIDSMLSEDDLNKRHYELMQSLLEEFNSNIHFLDMTLLEPYQQKLQSFMSNELSVFQKKLFERLEVIIESYKSISTLQIEEYIQQMENIVKSDDIYTEEEFQGLHTVFSSDVINLFENHLKENPCAQSQSYFLRFKQSIDEVFHKMNDTFEMKRQMKIKELELAINDFSKMYENEMKDNQKCMKTIEELKDCHQRVKEKLNRIFQETYRFRDSTQSNAYIERLEENFENCFIDFEVILELKIEKQKTLTKNLRLDLRRFYKEELQKFFQNKLFVRKPYLDKCHKLVLRKAIERFGAERGDISEDEFKDLAEESVDDIFVKIAEENEMKRPTSSQAIGIDLGTTNSCVAYFKPDAKNPNNVVVIPNEGGHLTTPSVVSYRDNSRISIGQEAKDEIHVYPRNTISSNKRLIGRRYDDESVQNDMNLWSYRVVDDGNNKPLVSVQVNGQDMLLHPEQISAKILRKMKEIAENHLGCEVTKAVITVPAYFNDGQKEATKHAGQLAGLEVLRVINEPTAAAIAFKVDRNEETEIRNVLIFDFGGGTFDVSVLEINRGKIIVKAVGGDNHLGGDDIDTNIIKYCLEQFYMEFKIRPEGVEGEAAMCRLRNKCEKHKKKLTSVECTVIAIDNFYQKLDLRVVLTRDKFEELNHHLFLKSIDLVKRTLEEKDINLLSIDDVVLVGGTTRIPKVQEMLSNFFGGKPLNHWINPDEAVAKGAAIQAAFLNGQQFDASDQLELKDVTPLSLGIRIKGGKMSVIIPRNSPVPTTVTKQYYTSEDYQTVVGIKIYEGEKEMANDNHMLGQFDLSGIPRAPQGDQPIDVTFSLNDEGILHVNAKILSTGGENDIEITEHKGRLTTELIEQLIAQENPSEYFGDLFKQM